MKLSAFSHQVSPHRPRNIHQPQAVRRKRLIALDWTLKPQPYQTVWKEQQRLVRDRIADENKDDTLLLVQHEPVYTLGAGSTLNHLKCDEKHLPYPLIRTERGGEVTCHGPGQLVIYPILNLRRFRCDLHWYLRSLEDVILMALRDVSGIEGHRIQDMTGVWVGDAKIAAIGIRARRWITYHGVALNVTMNLDPFDWIVPCGIPYREVTSVKELIGGDEDVPTQTQLSDQKLMEEYKYAVMDAIDQIFDVEVVSGTLQSL